MFMMLAYLPGIIGFIILLAIIFDLGPWRGIFKGFLKMIGFLLMLAVIWFFWGLFGSMSWGWTVLYILVLSGIFIPIIVSKVRKRSAL